MENPSLLTIEEAARIAGVCPRTIRRLYDAGKLPAANYGTGRKKVLRIDPAVLSNVQPFEPPPPRESRRRRRTRAAANRTGNVYPPALEGDA